MNLERLTVLSIVAALSAGLLALSDYVGANVIRQGDGTLAQEPMHLGATVSPNFIMAIDDSGSMTFQTLFPGADGEGCWSSGSFFNGSALRTSGSCDYLYVLPGPRINNYRGVPPFDAFGFARSPDYNPTYFDPDELYEPWINAALASYGNASLTATRIDPRQAAAVNLFAANYTKTQAASFFVQNGMVIPSGTKYSTFNCTNTNNGVCTAWGNTTADFTAAISFTWNAGAQPIAIEYTPAVVYLKDNRTIAGYSAATAVNNACGSGCTLYRYVPTSNAAKQNFANWFSYYGNRNRAMVAGLTRSLSGISNMRVGYFTINSRPYTDVTMRDMNVAADKTALMNSVLTLPASGSTPNRFAVEQIGKQFNTNTSVIQHACQKNAGMLFTDGYSNQGGPDSYGNVDGAWGAPYNDAHGNTMADITGYFYNTRLRADLPAGRVPVANPEICASGTPAQKKGVDCNANLHMNFYGVTLGARGKLFGATYGVTPDGGNSGPLATTQALAAATSPAWEPRTNDDPNTVDEIWHATMNARGGYINARTPAAITNAMRDVLASVGVAGGVSGSLAITGSRIGDRSLSVEPRFDRDGTDWHGDVVAFKPIRGTGSAITYQQIWSASSKLPAVSGRNILYATADGDSVPAVANFATSGPSSLAALCANYLSGSCGPLPGTDVNALGVTAAEAVAYLAGDRSLEGTKLRKRTSAIGDIVNSAPVVSAPTDDFGYTTVRSADGTFAYDPYEYNKHLDAKKDRDRIVYVGANDGMLHAFNGETGVEEFAYIPSTAVGYMGNLLFPTSPNFQHRYFVDGSVAVSDALFGSNDWRSVLVGSSGAGGRSVFGLDVTQVGSGKFDAKNVLWEVNDQITGAVGDRIGHVLGKPVIVPVRGSNGEPEWKAIFGGGYGNRLNNAVGTMGTATLFVVDMKTGTVEYIDAKESGGPVTPNGLGNVAALDQYTYRASTGYVKGTDGMVDTVYSGDLHGNVWKFDLTKKGVDRVALGGKPLFTAKDGIADTSKRQAITGGFEATTGPRGGVLLLFGTGSFSFDGDKQNIDLQTFYGVLDMPGESLGLPLTRANLQVQTLQSDDTITGQTVNYFTQRGWYLDLAVSGSAGPVKTGERMVGYPLLDGETLYFPTYAPTAGDSCSGGGVNYLYGLSALSGSGGLGAVSIGTPTGNSPKEGTGRLPLDTTGSAPVKEVGLLTTGKQGGLSGNPTDQQIKDFDNLGAEYCLSIVQASGGKPLYRVRPCGRQSWRQTR